MMTNASILKKENRRAAANLWANNKIPLSTKAFTPQKRKLSFMLLCFPLSCCLSQIDSHKWLQLKTAVLSNLTQSQLLLHPAKDNLTTNSRLSHISVYNRVKYEYRKGKVNNTSVYLWRVRK